MDINSDSDSDDDDGDEEVGVVEVKADVEDADDAPQDMKQTDAAAAAVRQAEAEGLTLQRSDNAAGYRGVSKKFGCRTKPFFARVFRDSKQVHLGGVFATAEKAALAYARTPEAQAEVANPKPMPLTAVEAVAQAAAEGLELEPSSRASDYKGVKVSRRCSSSYQARSYWTGKRVSLGCFATAEEATLVVARAKARTDLPAASLRPAATKRTAPPPKPPPTNVNPSAKPHAKPVIDAAKAPLSHNGATGAASAANLMPGKGLVGQRISVLWAHEATWYSGSIRAYTETTETHLVVYDDGDQRHEELSDPALEWKLLASDAAAPPLQTAARGAARAARRAAAAPRPPQAPAAGCAPRPWPGAASSSKQQRTAATADSQQPVQMSATAGGTQDEEPEEAEQSKAAKEAVDQAEAEGLTLQPSSKNVTGYRCVHKDCRSKYTSKPFFANVWRAGKLIYLGYFATAEEAALAYARTPKAQAQVANPKPMPHTAVEAVAQAAAEGLKLEPSDNASGYKGVSVETRGAQLRYRARAPRAGNAVSFGAFTTAEEAALTVARANARTYPNAALPRRVAAKRAALPPKLSPAKQPRSSLLHRRLQPVAPSTCVTSAPPALGPAAFVAPAPTLFKEKLDLLKRDLGITPSTPAIPAVAEANALMGIAPSAGDSLGAQLDAVLAAIG